MKNLAESKGGKCLSTEYKNLFSKLKWQCSKGHTWEAIPSNIKHHNKWCPHCSKNARFSLEIAQEIARKRGGQCLSTEYKNMHTKMEWKCAKDHIWKSRLHDVKDDNNWCPECSSHKSERICRKFFETMFNAKFPKVRPDWLKSPAKLSKRFNLELDGYNEELKIAFEFQGHQHYVHSKQWHKKRTLQMQKDYDELKRKLCKSNGVILIEIHWKIKPENLGKYIEEQCRINGVKPPMSAGNIDYRSFDIYKDMPIPKTHKERYWERKLADPERFKQLKRGSDQRYLAKHREKLKEYHKRKYWAIRDKIIAEKRLREEKVILRSKEFHLNEMKQIAESRGGKCLSNSFVSAKTKMEFECKEGHRWFSVPHHVKDGSWCPECYNIRRIDRLRNNRKHLTIGLQRT